jgi:hypothetical protein
MSCTDKKYVIKEIVVSSDTGLQGPQGPQGPTGPPGPVPDEYPADQVTLVGLDYDNVQEALEALLYVPVDITTFTAGTSSRENGQVLTALTFNWTINKDIVSQTLAGPPEMTPVVLTAGQRTVNVVLANLASNATFTLEVDDGVQTDQRNFNLSFLNGNYYGDVDIPGAIDSAFILSLTKVLKSNRTLTYTTNAIGTQYNWYAIPQSYGTPTFFAGGFEGGFQLVQSLSFTNAYGYVETYDVYRSDFPDIGPGVTIDVQ